jgi:pimeloyl-ACP methyl ester carboxylesterase
MDSEASASGEIDLTMLDAAGTKLAVTRTGRGPAIVICLHAIGHGARDFARLPREIGSQYQLVAIDWPGHGASPPEQAPPSGRRYAELLAAAIEGLGISSAYVLGHSIGGAAAIRYAALYPDRVRGLILCNPAGLQAVGFAARFVCRRMAAFFARGTNGDPRFPALFRRYYEREVLPAAAATWRREEIIATARQMAPILQQAWNGFAEPDADLRRLAPSIQCPVLFAWARRDRYVAWSRSKRAARTFPRHQVQLFEGGHSAFLEDPAPFAETMKQFLEDSGCKTETTTRPPANRGTT